MVAQPAGDICLTLIMPSVVSTEAADIAMVFEAFVGTLNLALISVTAFLRADFQQRRPCRHRQEKTYRQRSGAPAYPEIDTVANKGGLNTEKIEFSYLAKTPELFTYDDDGNLLSDGRFR